LRKRGISGEEIEEKATIIGYASFLNLAMKAENVISL